MRESIVLIGLVVAVGLLYAFQIPRISSGARTDPDVYTNAVFALFFLSLTVRAVVAVLEEKRSGGVTEDVSPSEMTERDEIASGPSDDSANEEFSGGGPTAKLSALVATEDELYTAIHHDLAPSSVPKFRKQGFVTIGVVGLYVLALPVLGYFVATFLSTVALLLTLGARKPIKILLTSSVLVVALTLVFTSVLYVPLPRGIGVFADLSIWLLRFLVV